MLDKEVPTKFWNPDRICLREGLLSPNALVQAFSFVVVKCIILNMDNIIMLLSFYPAAYCAARY